MSSLTISLNDIIYNNIFLAIICSLFALLLLFIDRCIFIKKNNYVTYIKIFFLILIIVYLVLLFKDTNIESLNQYDLEIDNSPFN